MKRPVCVARICGELTSLLRVAHTAISVNSSRVHLATRLAALHVAVHGQGAALHSSAMPKSGGTVTRAGWNLGEPGDDARLAHRAHSPELGAGVAVCVIDRRVALASPSP